MWAKEEDEQFEQKLRRRAAFLHLAHGSLLLTESPSDHHQPSRCLIAEHLIYSPLFVGPRRPRPAAAANFYSCPFVQHQTVMNAAGGIINDLTVKSLRSWTMRPRTNNRGRENPWLHTQPH